MWITRGRHRGCPRRTRRRPPVVAAALAACLLAVGSAGARPLGEGSPYHALVLSGIEDVFSGRFPQALETCDRIVAIDPESPVGHFYRGATYWWMFLVELEDDEIGHSAEANLDLAIEKGRARLDRDPEDLEALFYTGGAYGFRARYRILKRQWWGAAWDGKRGRDLLEKVAALDPEWVDTDLGLGMYNYYVDVLPAYFKVLAVVAFIPAGDRERGLEQLGRAMREGVYARSEARFFLFDIMKDHEKDYVTALHHARELARAYPENPFFPLLQAIVYTNHLGRWRESIATLESLLEQLETSAFMFAEGVAVRARYFLAKTYFFRGDNDRARVEFERILASDPDGPTWVLVWTHLRLGQIHDLAGRRPEAVREYRKVLEMEKSGETHRAARQWIREPFQGW